MPNDAEIAYTAGIIDGEGCIRLQPKTFGLDVSVGNTDISLLLWLRDRWGGKIYPNRSLNQRINAKPFFHWRLNGKGGFPFLKAILPYLVIKKNRAEKALELENLYCKQNNYIDGFNETCREKRMKIQRDLAAMNQRGLAN